MRYSNSLILFFLIATIVCFVTNVDGKSNKKVKEIVKSDIIDEEDEIQTSEKFYDYDQPVMTEPLEIENIEDDDNNKDENKEVEVEEDENTNDEIEEDENTNDEVEEDENKNVEVEEVEIVMDETVIIIKNKDVEDFFKRNKKMVLGCFEKFGNDEYIDFKNASLAIIEDPNEASEKYFDGNVLKFVYINDYQCRNTIKRFTGVSMFKNDVVYCINKRCYEYNPNELKNIQNLRMFLEQKEMPYIFSYDPSYKKESVSWNLPFVVYINNDENQAQIETTKFLRSIAESHSDEFYFIATTDEEFDIKTPGEPRDKNVLIFAPEFQTFYSIQEILEEEDVIDKVSIEFFINQYKLGFLTPNAVVQEFEKVFGSNEDSFVIDLIPRYYYPAVMNPIRDSLVIYYKRDCPFSLEFLKTFEKIGKKYANYRTKFSVVKYESEDQKIPKMSLWRKLEAYPTVVLYRANPLSREKKEFFIYPDNIGRSAVTLDRWVQQYSFYKPKAVFTDDDYKEQEILEVDTDNLEIDEEKEEKINEYLRDPDLIFTRFGYGKELQVVSEDNEDSGEEEADFFFDNVKTDSEIPMTGTYFQLISSTYRTKISTYTPPPSIYDDDENEKKDEE
jgi:hypothetical protein